ncbi:hypothetical protein LCGC14_0446610 [marine sediment metagenome]|uniref:SF4 helicase domain-containing protein n=1 Tax=marine sediment metagenome TaxID=412755 RepID=A0A0F9SIV3_9ZZZZ
MITVEHVVAMAIRDMGVLDELGEALRSDLVLANPYFRRIATFADDFVLQHRKLPAPGDWDMWLSSLEKGLHDGTRENLGRLLAMDLSTFTPAYFGAEALKQLQQAAVQVARARLNEAGDVSVDTFVSLAEQVGSVQSAGIKGLAYLNDLKSWVKPAREDELLTTGYPTLDRHIGGWGNELWMMFADTGIGKSMWLQNATTNLARRGARCLHLSLELGVRPQIQRYYRAIAQAERAEFNTGIAEVTRRLKHWFRLAQGEVILLELPAYSLEPDELKRIIERLSRSMGEIDVLTLDYLDLLTLSDRASAKHGYTDLGRITHEVRALCPAFDITVLTASQAVKRPERAGHLTTRDMGDSYQKVRGVDGLLSLNQLPEEAEVHQGRIGLLKLRDSGGRGQEIQVYVNRELAIIQELDTVNTLELRQRLGHMQPVPTKDDRKLNTATTK